MRQANLMVVLGLAVLTTAIVLLIQAGCLTASEAQPAMVSPMAFTSISPEERSMAGPDPAQPGGTLLIDAEIYTVTLPVLFRYYAPSYFPAYGVTMYGGVSDAGGLQAMKIAGARWAISSFWWASVEATRGQYNWSSFDTAAQNAQAAGMDLFVLFQGNPSWAAVLPGGPVTDTHDLVDFVTAMVERYDGDGTEDAPGHPRIRYWSFYGEPDNWDLALALGGRGYWGHNGTGYAAMLSAVSPAIHAADPEAKVLIGGLAYDSFEEDGGPFVRSFLADTLAALNGYPGGAKAYIDAIAFHYYPIALARWSTLREKADEIRGIMADHGVGDLPLLLSEFGYWSSDRHGSTELGQAQWLVQNYARGLSLDLRLLAWYKVFDAAVAGSAEDKYPDRTTGLLDVYGGPKLSYAAYQALTRELARVRYVGLFQAADAEGYVFEMPTGQQKTVLWGSADTVRVAFPYTHLRVVTATGNPEYDIWDNQRLDGAPGDVDDGIVGQIELEIHANEPIYVEQR